MSIVLIYNMTANALLLSLNGKPIGELPPEQFANSPALHPLVVLRDTTDEPFDNMFRTSNRLAVAGGATQQTYQIELDPAEFDPEQNVALTLFPASAMLAWGTNHRELTPVRAPKPKPPRPRPRPGKGA